MAPDSDAPTPAPPFRAYSAFLRERFHEKVFRIALDAGFGCPHREGGRGRGGCIFCGPAGSGTLAFDSNQGIREQMEAGISRLKRRGIHKYVAYFQAFSNTAAPLPVLARLYREAVSFPGVVGLSIGTRPDLVFPDLLKLLADMAAPQDGSLLDIWLELGLQSASDASLKFLSRGHDVACFDRAVLAATQEFGISVAAHVILGLPFEGEEEMMATADHLAGLPVRGVKVHHLFVEKDTELARIHEREDFTLLSEEAYIELTIGFLRRLPREVVIMRLAGKSDPKRLIGPRWSLDPSAVIQKIEREMGKRGVAQGDRIKSRT